MKSISASTVIVLARGGAALAFRGELGDKPVTHHRTDMRALLLALAALTFALPAFGQALPNHLDPGAREMAPNLSAVPTIRFLTTGDFPPFNFRDEQGQLVGFNIDLARSLCADLKLVCTIQAWPWDQAAQALEDNQGDALIAGLALTPENGANFDFSQIYLMFPGRFVTSVEGAVDFDPAALAGRRVAARKGSAHAEFVRRYLPEAQLVEFASELQALDALRKSEVDAYFGDAMRAAFWLNDNVGCCDFAGEPYFRPDLFGDGLSIAVPTGNDAMRQAIDYGLTRLKRSGAFDELYLRWFPVSFY